MDAAMRIFEMTKTFPAEEKFSMVDQMRRCSRSVCTNIGEELDDTYDKILRQLVRMIDHPDQWTIH